MPDLGQFIVVAAALFSLLVGAGLALQRSLVLGLRERADDQEKRINDLKDEREEDKAEIARQGAVIRSQEDKIHTLGSVVTGEVYLKALTDLLEHHVRNEEAHWRDDFAAASRMILEMHEAVKKLL